MEVLLHSTLAGGVVMASAARLIDMPGISVLCGAFVGFVSAYQFVKNFKDKELSKFSAPFVHVFPGIIGHIIYIIMIAVNGDPVAEAVDSVGSGSKDGAPI
jgi:hypothetical protein